MSRTEKVIDRWPVDICSTVVGDLNKEHSLSPAFDAPDFPRLSGQKTPRDFLRVMYGAWDGAPSQPPFS